jgi:hypothetical protein
MKTIRTPAWQVIIADLALILFLTTLAGASASEDIENGVAQSAPVSLAKDEPSIASSQLIYRPVAGAPAFADWIKQEVADPRLQITIHAAYSDVGDDKLVVAQALKLLNEAGNAGLDPKLVMRQSMASDVYATASFERLP